MELWLPIEGYRLYEISSLGRIRNVQSDRILRQAQHPRSGFKMVSLSDGKTNKTHNVHILVANHFIGPGEQGFAVRFIDGDRTNCGAHNLEWRTASQVREFTMDSKLTGPTDRRAVVALDLGPEWVEFPNALAAARELGGLEKYILLAARSYGNMSYLRTGWVFKMALDLNPSPR